METEALLLRKNRAGQDLKLRSTTVNEPKPNEIQVRPLYVGVCGTDLHLLQGQSSVPHRISPSGLTLGHEGVAQILKRGSLVEQFREGDIVALESLICCSHCQACREGHFNQCENASLIGAQQDGLFARVMNVPASAAHRITDQVQDPQDLLAYACLEPAAVAFHACENAGLKPGDDVLIFGAGPIGAFCAMWAKELFGANQIFVREPLSFRRDLVRPWCTQTFDLHEEISHLRPNVVFEASGVLEHLDHCLPQIKARGSIVLLARSGRPLLLTQIDHLITNAISVRGSRGHLGGAYQKLIALQAKGKIKMQALVTEVLPSLSVLQQKLEQPAFFEQQGKVMVKINDVR